MGFPVPGETALLAAAFLAHGGGLDIVAVVAVAAVAAIVGDNLGYVVGRHGGRRLFERKGPFYERRMELIERGERFMSRHGGKAVFLGRWFAGLRVTAAWLAGANRMPWRSFLLWNTLGGIVWATGVGVAGYLAGEAAGQLLKEVGIAGLVGVVAAIVVVLLLRRRRKRGDEPRLATGAPGQNTGDSV
jgi:membrane protein DedA with SNARE-associated domain